MKRDEIWLANLNPSRGTEPGKIRPVVIIQTDLLNKLSHPSTLICAVTSNLTNQDNILRVRIPKGESGIEVESEILVDQIRAIDNLKLIEKIGFLDLNQTFELREKIKAILDF
jgi:mRNA interferase MazF